MAEPGKQPRVLVVDDEQIIAGRKSTPLAVNGCKSFDMFRKCFPLIRA